MSSNCFAKSERQRIDMEVVTIQCPRLSGAESFDPEKKLNTPAKRHQ